MSSDLISAIGCEPQTMALPDVYPALDQGLLNVAVTASATSADIRTKGTGYLIGPIPSSYAQTLVAFNAEQWDSMPLESQEIILEEGEKHATRNRETISRWDTEGIGALIGKGMNYNEFTPRMLEGLRDAAAEMIIPNRVQHTR